MKKYIYANIKLPIEITKNGPINPMTEYIQIDFSNCDELPPKQDTDTNQLFFKNNFNSLFNCHYDNDGHDDGHDDGDDDGHVVNGHDDGQITLFIKPEEFVKKRQLQQLLTTTFKNINYKKQSPTRYTLKKR
jgi:hypothetical protein